MRWFLLIALLVSTQAHAGRYHTTNTSPSLEMLDPLEMKLSVSLPHGISTVGDAIEYLIRPTGYQSAFPEKDPLLPMDLPQSQRSFVDLSVREALSALGGPTRVLVVDRYSRKISLELRDTSSLLPPSKPIQLAGPASAAVLPSPSAFLGKPDPTPSLALPLAPTYAPANAWTSVYLTNVSLKAALQELLPGWKLQLDLPKNATKGAIRTFAGDGTRMQLVNDLLSRMQFKKNPFPHHETPLLIVSCPKYPKAGSLCAK